MGGRSAIFICGVGEGREAPLRLRPGIWGARCVGGGGHRSRHRERGPGRRGVWETHHQPTQPVPLDDAGECVIGPGIVAAMRLYHVVAALAGSSYHVAANTCDAFHFMYVSNGSFAEKNTNFWFLTNNKPGRCPGRCPASCQTGMGLLVSHALKIHADIQVQWQTLLGPPSHSVFARVGITHLRDRVEKPAVGALLAASARAGRLRHTPDPVSMVMLTWHCPHLGPPLCPAKASVPAMGVLISAAPKPGPGSSVRVLLTGTLDSAHSRLNARTGPAE